MFLSGKSSRERFRPLPTANPTSREILTEGLLENVPESLRENSRYLSELNRHLRSVIQSNGEMVQKARAQDF